MRKTAETGKYAFYTRGLRAVAAVSLALSLLPFVSCSSLPDKPTEILTMRNQAVSELGLGNQYAVAGNTTLADSYFSSAYDKAMSVDDIPLACAVLFSRISLAVDAGNVDGARTLQAFAASLAAHPEDRELSAVAKLYLARIYLYQAAVAKISPENNAREALSIADTAMPLLKSDPFNQAFAMRIRGEAYKLLEQWKSAESAFTEAAAIHTKHRYITEIGQDWYFIAQVRSLSGNNEGGVEALKTAIKFDRDAENSGGLGMDYLAMGIIFEKMSMPDKARYAWDRSREIFTAAGLKNGADMATARLSSLPG